MKKKKLRNKKGESNSREQTKIYGIYEEEKVHEQWKHMET